MTPAELHDYIFTELVCGCGDPAGALTLLRDFLQAIHDRRDDGDLSFDEAEARIASLQNENAEAMHWWFWYLLDQRDLIEHGGNVSGGWLTDKGQELLTALKASDIEKLCEAEHVEDPPARHLMAVPVTVELLMEMVREGYRGGAECTSGIPADAVLVSSSIKTEANGAQAAHLIFEHESFPLVEPGTEIPTKQIIFFRVRLEGESKFDPLAREQ